MEIWHDGGLKHASNTHAYWNRIKEKIGKVRKVSIDNERNFSMEIQCHDNRLILLSGCGCGYPEAASSVSEKILKDLGVPNKIAELVHGLGDHYRFYFNNKGIFVRKVNKKL